MWPGVCQEYSKSSEKSMSAPNIGGRIALRYFRAADLILPAINSGVSPRIQAYSSMVGKTSTGIFERSPGSVRRKMLTYLFCSRTCLMSSSALGAFQSMRTQSAMAPFAMNPSLSPSKLSTLMTCMSSALR